MNTTSITLACAVAVASGVLAQDVRLDKPATSSADSIKYTLNPVLVTATRSERPIYRVPYAIDIIEKDAIQRGEASLSLEEVLRAVPGVVVHNRFNPSQGDRITLRGIGSRTPFGVRGIKIILDGIPLTMPDGQSQLNNLDLASTGKVEILRGPTSSLYGNTAGGLINLQTESSQTVPLWFQPQFIAGSNGLLKWQGKISGKIGKQSYFANASKLQLEGYREHSAASTTALNVVGRSEISNRLSLTTLFNYFDAPYLLNPSSLSKTEVEASPTATRFFIKQQAAGKQTRQGQGGITFKYRRESQQFETTLYGLSRSLLNPIPGRIIELDRTAGGARAVFSQRFQAGGAPWRWTVGADYEAQHDTRVEFQNQGIPASQVGIVAEDKMFNALQYGPRLLDQREEVSGIGPFAQLELEFGPKWAMTLGARYDSYHFKATDHFFDDGVDNSGTREMDKLSPMSGLAFRPHPALAAYVNYATAFQIPTTTELSNRPEGEGGFNPDLQPETMRSFEFGIKGAWPEKRCSYDLAFYLLDIRDMLVPYQIPNSASEEVFFRNAGKTRNRGVETKLQWIPLRGWRADLSYTFMNFEFEDFMVETSTGNTQLSGNKVPGVPRHHFFAGLAYEHGSGVYAEINWQQFGRYFANDFNGAPPNSSKPADDFINESYPNSDLRLGWQRSFKSIQAEIFGGVNNLGDGRYNGSVVPNAAGDRFFEPAAGRSWYAGINFSFFRN